MSPHPSSWEWKKREWNEGLKTNNKKLSLSQCIKTFWYKTKSQKVKKRWPTLLHQSHIGGKKNSISHLFFPCRPQKCWFPCSQKIFHWIFSSSFPAARKGREAEEKEEGESEQSRYLLLAHERTSSRAKVGNEPERDRESPQKEVEGRKTSARKYRKYSTAIKIRFFRLNAFYEINDLRVVLSRRNSQGRGERDSWKNLRWKIEIANCGGRKGGKNWHAQVA